MNEPFYKDGLNFSCQRCSSCCRHDPGFVNLSKDDIENLQKWSNFDKEHIIDSFCRWVDRGDGYDYLCLKEKPGYDCILWDEGCIAYEYRPLQCSSYPFWASLVSDQDWWESNAQHCPGIDKGMLYSRSEIEEHLTRRRNHPYIRRKAGK